MPNPDCTDPSDASGLTKAEGGGSGVDARPRGEETPQGAAAEGLAFRVTGVDRETARDVNIVIRAATPANARVKATLLGVVVTKLSLFADQKLPAGLRQRLTKAASQSAAADDRAAPQGEPADVEPSAFAAARWSSWPKIFGTVSVIWGGAWLLGGLMGLIAGGLLLQWYPDLVDFLVLAFMMFYGCLGVQAGHRMTNCVRSALGGTRFVWGLAFLVGVVYLLWPRLMTPGGLAGSVIFLVMSVVYPVFLFFWFSDQTVKAQVKAWYH